MYFTIQITKKNGVTLKQLFDFETLDEAKSNYFYFLSSSYADTDVTYILGEVIDEHGVILCMEVKKETEAEE